MTGSVGRGRGRVGRVSVPPLARGGTDTRPTRPLPLPTLPVKGSKGSPLVGVPRGKAPWRGAGRSPALASHLRHCDPGGVVPYPRPLVGYYPARGRPEFPERLHATRCPGPASRLLRRRRAGDRDRRARAEEIRPADLCPSRDRAQPSCGRGSAHSGAPCSSTSWTRSRPARAPIFSAHGVAQQVETGRRRARPAGDRRHLPAGRQGAQRGPALRRQGREIVLIGHAGHAEVEGTIGQIPAKVHLVADRRGRRRGCRSRDPDKLAYITQTTLSVDDTTRHHRRAEGALPDDRRPGRARTSAMPRRTASRRCATWPGRSI